MNHYTKGKWVLWNYMNHLSKPGDSSVIVWLQDLLPRAARSWSRGVALTSAITCSARFKPPWQLSSGQCCPAFAAAADWKADHFFHVGKPVIPLATNLLRHLQRKTLPLPETLLHLNMDQSTASPCLKCTFEVSCYSRFKPNHWKQDWLKLFLPVLETCPLWRHLSHSLPDRS